jgi:hypothetical protein
MRVSRFERRVYSVQWKQVYRSKGRNRGKRLKWVLR